MPQKGLAGVDRRAAVGENEGHAMGLKILGVSGSLRSDSITRRALERALRFGDELGAQTRLLDLGYIELPMFRPDAIASENVRTVAAAVSWADAFLLATPDYHGSMSGPIKNFLDYHWEGLSGKLFGFLCASHERGLTAMEQMRAAVGQCHGWGLPYNVSVHTEEDFDESGAIRNPRVAARLRMIARDLGVYGALIRDQFRRDLVESQPDTFAARYA
jgi:NAD(P)H-dependent FMN reductase